MPSNHPSTSIPFHHWPFPDAFIRPFTHSSFDRKSTTQRIYQGDKVSYPTVFYYWPDWFNSMLVLLSSSPLPRIRIIFSLASYSAPSPMLMVSRHIWFTFYKYFVLSFHRNHFKLDNIRDILVPAINYILYLCTVSAHSSHAGTFVFISRCHWVWCFFGEQSFSKFVSKSKEIYLNLLNSINGEWLNAWVAEWASGLMKGLKAGDWSEEGDFENETSSKTGWVETRWTRVVLLVEDGRIKGQRLTASFV